MGQVRQQRAGQEEAEVKLLIAYPLALEAKWPVWLHPRGACEIGTARTEPWCLLHLPVYGHPAAHC